MRTLSCTFFNALAFALLSNSSCTNFELHKFFHSSKTVHLKALPMETSRNQPAVEVSGRFPNFLIVYIFFKFFINKVKKLWEGRKIWKNLPPVLTKQLFLLSSVKTSGRLFQIFVAVSEKLNFKNLQIIHHWWTTWYILYARHYKLRLVCFYLIFHRGFYCRVIYSITKKLCTKQGNLGLNPWFIIKSGFKSSAGFNGARMVNK